jgi:hypothetical protein
MTSRGGNSSDGKGVTDGVENLDGVPFRAIGCNVVIYQLNDIAAPETMLWQVMRQRHITI